MKWKDEVVSSSALIGKFNLHLYRNKAGEGWYAVCSGTSENIALQSYDLEHAKTEALAKMQYILHQALTDIGNSL